MDIIKSFMLEDGLFRGCYIDADKTTRDIWEKHTYPDSLYSVFNEAVLMALALSAGIKYQGVFSLQIKGDGPVSSLFIDVTADKKVRGYISLVENADLKNKTTLLDLFGQGQMIFSVAGLGQEPYQGIVGLRHNSLMETVKEYFRLSEQIDTDIVLRQKGKKGRCILVQKMPDKAGISVEESFDLWETVQVLLNSVQDKELFSDNLTPDEILFRLFHANKITVFPDKYPVFECRCYRGKMESFLKKLSSNERQSLYNENNEIEVACQFCDNKYVFTKMDLGDNQ